MTCNLIIKCQQILFILRINYYLHFVEKSQYLYNFPSEYIIYILNTKIYFHTHILFIFLCLFFYFSNHDIVYLYLSEIMIFFFLINKYFNY